jgi:uncharacterized protein (TIGR03437 family)
MLKFWVPVLFACCVQFSFAADFLTGQAARAVIGQKTFTDNTSGNSDTRFGGIGGLAFANNTLFATDANRLGLLPNNSRVLVFQNIDQVLPPPDASIPENSGRCPLCIGKATYVLGQQDFEAVSIGTGPDKMRLPTAVATDGIHVAVADTSNNRVLLWNSMPSSNGQAADVVIGQTNFTNNRPGLSANTLRGPQGVWIRDGKLFVADTQNNRVLIWNSIPTQNGQAADIVLGQPNFSTNQQVNVFDLNLPGSAQTMLSPTAVTTDGTRLFVADLGFNRVLIWNALPTQNQQAADVVIGQANFKDTIANNAPALCPSSGTDSDGKPTYPARCGATLDFPRFALSDGQRLFVADGGNDRVLIFNQIPTENGARADIVLGQPDEFAGVLTSNDPQFVSASNVTPAPTSLAWDGVNLYVADPTDYRILVFTPGDRGIEPGAVVNTASRAIFANASVLIGGTIRENDTVTLKISDAEYKYTIVAGDTTDTVAKALTALVQNANDGAGDPNATAYEEDGRSTIVLVARQPGFAGTQFGISTSVSTGAQITASTSNSTLTAYGDAATIAPGTLITIKAAPGTTFSATTAAAPTDATQLPWTLNGVEVYIDGARAPLLMVSPTEINAQAHWELIGSTSASVYVRIQNPDDGSVTVTHAIGMNVAQAAPGIFACDPAHVPDTCAPGGTEPRAAIALHSSDFAATTVSIDGSIQAGDVATIAIEERKYSYTVVKDDTLAIIRDKLIEQINANPEEKVTASAAGQFTRIRIHAKVPGPEGNGIPVSTEVTTSATNLQGALLAVNATNPATCCASTGGSLVTPDNPAMPGETILLTATGLGRILPGEEDEKLVTGKVYDGAEQNTPAVNVNASVTGASANVLSARLKPGTFSTYEIELELSAGLPENAQTRINISQSFKTSNTVIVPVGPPQVPTN